MLLFLWKRVEAEPKRNYDPSLLGRYPSVFDSPKNTGADCTTISATNILTDQANGVHSKTSK